METGSSKIDVTPCLLNFKNEGGDAKDMSNSTARDTVLPTPFASPTNLEEEVQDITPVGNLPGATILPADLKLMKVYGDYIHQNDGLHLDGGVQDDGAWQEGWRQLIVLPRQRNDAPSSAVGQRFICI
jgi:hypothetical protein